jgi:L-threonylcarbamoyladenylate synthase
MNVVVPKPLNIAQAISMLKRDAVIAYPTEAVFGLGCDPDSAAAVYALLELKQRAIEKGLILIAADYQQLLPYLADNQLNSIQRESMFASWPGPVTYVVPAKKETPKWLTGAFNSLAVRVTDHPVVIELCRAFNKPLVSTSANLSGLLPCRSDSEVWAQFGANFPVVWGETGKRLHPSEIRDAITGEQLRIG